MTDGAVTTNQQSTVTLRKDITILIAEDERGHYILTKNCLRQAGLPNETLWLEDGQATLDFLGGLEENTPTPKHLLLLDIRMPKVDGVEVLKKMKSNPRYEQIPIIMLTTSEDQSLARECYDLGCEAHIVKPPGPALLKAIDRIGRRI